jgi:hypothetical protein
MSGIHQAVGGSFVGVLLNYIANPRATPAAFGDAFEGGFYAGMIWNQLTQSSGDQTIGTGQKTIVLSVNMRLNPLVYMGQMLEIRSRSNPFNNMQGTVVSAENETLVLNISSVSGSGTFSDWSIMSRYRIIFAPKLEGESANILFKSNTSKNPAECETVSEGFSSTMAMVNSGSSSLYPAAYFCRAVSSGGYADWYLASRDEQELAWRNLKPYIPNNTGTRSNAAIFDYKVNGSYGDSSNSVMGTNNNSYPIGLGYTTSQPAQTTSSLFIDGGSEAFEPRYYADSSELTNTNFWLNIYDNNYGHQGNAAKTFSACRVRAVRRSII